MAFRIITDTCCDFPQSFYDELNLKATPLSIRYREQEYNSFTEEQIRSFYSGLRAGEVATTAAVNPEGWATEIEPIGSMGLNSPILLDMPAATINAPISIV